MMDGYGICSVTPGKELYGTNNRYPQQIFNGDEQDANARFIVTACNSHDELVEALQGLMDAFIHTEGNKRGNQAKTDIIKYNQPHVSGALNRARHAIERTEVTQ